MLEALDELYYMQHRGGVGHYHVTRTRDGAVEVRCETPYPRMFEYGLVEGFCRNQKVAKPARYSVDYVEGPQEGDHTCTMIVRRMG
jgi:hypothetical protein